MPAAPGHALPVRQPNAVRYGYFPKDDSERYREELLRNPAAAEDSEFGRTFHAAHLAVTEWAGVEDHLISALSASASHMRPIIVIGGGNPPAVGTGMAELLTRGRYETIDLTPFPYRRVIEDRPLHDEGPKA